MLKITGCFSTILIFILAFGLVDVYAQTINLTPVSLLNDNDLFSSLATVAEINIVTIDSTPYAIVTNVSDDYNGIIIIDISNPVNPMTVSTITGDVSKHNTFRYSSGISTVTIDSTPYALIASYGADRINIVNLLNPADPTVTTSIRDGSTFDTLDGADDIAPFQIGESIYAIIVSAIDNGIQIIDITNPADPTAVSSVTDGDLDSANNTFDVFERVNNVTTVQIDGSTYALTASARDDSVQIIDISNPTDPLAVYAITDGDRDSNNNIFDTLNGTRDVITVQIDGSTYALVASGRDAGIQIIDISNPADPLAVYSITDGSLDSSNNTFDELGGANNINILTIDSTIYALVAASLDNGIQIIDISNPADPLAVSSITDGVDGFNALDGADHIVTVQIDSTIYALVAAFYDDGIQIIRIAESRPDLLSPTSLPSPALPPSPPTPTPASPPSPLTPASPPPPPASSPSPPSSLTPASSPSPPSSLTPASPPPTPASPPSPPTPASPPPTPASPPPTPASPPPASSSSDGSSSDWKKKPTFGKSWEVYSDQFVKNGFTFNDYSLDITDNWHTDFVRTTTIIGEVNHVKMRVFAFDGLKYVQLSLGLPEIGATSDAETNIIVNLERNYDNPNDYDIVEIVHEQIEPLVNVNYTTASITPSLCNDTHTELHCYDIEIEFVVDAPLSHDVISISAIDSKRRTTTTHINEGVEFVGESLLPAETASIFIKKTNQGKGQHIILTQDDRRYNVWTDKNDYQWLKNSYGTWIQQDTPDMTISRDGAEHVMTRSHSEFDRMIQHERKRATSVFDSKSLQSVPEEPFSYDLDKPVPRHQDKSLLEKMKKEESLAFEKMLKLYIYDDPDADDDDDKP